MSIETYNTLSRRTEEFKPIEEGKVNFFVCGPTVYDYAHIGNAKTYTQFDFIVKYLRYRDYNVFYLQNITDIDDKIIKRAQKKGVSWKELADQYTQIFMEDMRSLGNDAVTEYARAIDYIPQIVEQVRTLEDKGFAYRTSDGIYFEISKFDEYGKLSRRTEVQ
ncbi:MAG: cysteine--tRNA ligase, partial [Candidatus Nealsonbacteria bacterium CG02_land_8_20_14_3_00_40_11]